MMAILSFYWLIEIGSSKSLAEGIPLFDFERVIPE